ncbi:hypothetical protein, partial [Devosia sp.]|uniref:hypothetical protein n=1 Tax=Devosia sp. TaxID=1871048 RepID=UPI0025BC212A
MLETRDGNGEIVLDGEIVRPDGGARERIGRGRHDRAAAFRPCDRDSNSHPWLLLERSELLLVVARGREK